MRKLVLFLCVVGVIGLGPSAYAQDADDQVLQLQEKMTREIHLTSEESRLIKPIIREYVINTRKTLQEVQGQAIINHEALRSNLKAIREDEYQKLEKILTPDQLHRWINKEKIRQTLNQDKGSENDEDSDFIFDLHGAKMKF